MIKRDVIQKTQSFVKKKMSGEATGHDFFHVLRVLKTAQFIAKNEKTKVDFFVIELAALLHDVSDWKFASGEKKPTVINDWLDHMQVPEKAKAHVLDIIDNLSFKGGTNTYTMRSLEGMIVQDADRLDALGAIGIARTFAYGGFKGREIYNPKIKPKKYASFVQYKNAKNTTINHFYEKLLLLKDRMHTRTAQQLAKRRHQLMQEYLEEFYKEWDSIFVL